MKKYLFVLAFASLLSACGGGESPNTTESSDSSGPIDRYIGTWSNKCDTWPQEDISALNGDGVSVVEILKFEKVSSTKATYTYTIKVFAKADMECTGQPIATLIKTGLNNSSFNISSATATMTTGFGTNELTYLGAQKLSTETVDKLQFSEAKLTNINGNFTVGGAIVKTGSSTFAQRTTDKLSKFKSNSQILLNPIENGITPTNMVEDEYLILNKQ